jgi:hypothetical protein
MSETRFRRLLILYVAVTIAAAGAAFIPGGDSQQLADALTQEPGSLLLRNVWLALAIGIPLLLAIIAGLVGLFLLRSWGRSVSLYSTDAGLLLYLFSGPELLSPLESVLFEVSTLLWGAVLALSYYSPIAVRLDANQPSEPDSPGGPA